jgi:competence protein ComGC
MKKNGLTLIELIIIVMISVTVILIGIGITVACVVGNKAVKTVNEKGLKSIVTQVWEGTNKVDK